MLSTLPPLHSACWISVTASNTGSYRAVKRSGALLLILIIALLPLTAAADRQVVVPMPPDGEVKPVGNPYLRGIASHAWWLDPQVYGNQLFPALDELQVTTVRLSIDWKLFEPQPGVWDWSLYDRVFGELAKRHILIIANFNTIPAWASTRPETCGEPVQEPATCELREDMYDEFANAMRAAVERYAWIQYWEFWNEPEMWEYLGKDGPTYLRHLKMFYDIAHDVNPEIVVAAQTLVGVEYMEYIYNLSDQQFGPGNAPWDAISIHPYNWSYEPEPGQPPLEINYPRVLGLRDLMIRRGDGDKKIWITEYGWVNGVENQARNLVATLDWMQTQPYIQFAHLHMLHDWNEEPQDQFGLMAIVPDENGHRTLDADTQFVPKPVFYDAFKNYPTDRYGRIPDDPGTRYFAATGHSISGRFLSAWEQRGGLTTLGFPLTRPYANQQPDGSWLLTQDFERGRLEYHPEFSGQPSEVLGAAVGRILTADRLGEAPFQPTGCQPDGGRQCFDTGFGIAGQFLDYWSTHDGIALLGLPISQQFEENGLTVQYFERGRLELHGEQQVMLGLVGRELLIKDGMLSPDGSVPTGDIRIPTRREAN